MTTLTGRRPDGTAVEVEISAERITAVRPVSVHDELPWLLPGLVDLQVNGYAGIDVNRDDITASDVRDLVASLWRRGVTTVLPTLVTAPKAKLLDALAAIAQVRAEDPLVRYSAAGVHVEGPYLSGDDGPRGAHDPEHIRPPDVGEFNDWQAACAGAVRIVTLAPESHGALEYIRTVTAQGTLVALGHSAADPDRIHAAADAGARLCTHLGNGCHVTLHRHNNHVWAQLADPRLTATFIADGHHLPRDAFISMVRAQGSDSAILVSDSVALAGQPPGDYTTAVGGAVTMHPDGRLTLAGSELLAGSGVALSDCLAWAATTGGLGLATATAMATENPARAIGLEARGRIGAGMLADIVLLEPDLTTVRLTMVRGVVVHRG